jgi:glycine/D-amino acid oxidase-like deaminating enzyme
MTVCTRPFRPAGPRIETEALNGKYLVHNYGHGGAGWSLSWGCAADAAALALAYGQEHAIAVVGAGVIGLTTAIRLAEAGRKVTIFAKDLPSETRSAHATGVWSPSSRIGLENNASADFADKWTAWARTSFAAHQRFVGASGEPVEYLRQFNLRDENRAPRASASRSYLHLDRFVGDLLPPWRDLERNEQPFPVFRARTGLTVIFNIARYMETLTERFHAADGRIVRREFRDASAILALPESVIINCTGYGAKELFGDETLTPVRGQINWFPPQPEARYGLYYRQVSALSRRDGVIVQDIGENEDFGFGIESETPDLKEATGAIERLQPLFARGTTSLFPFPKPVLD